MQLHTKALYNLLKYNQLEDPSLKCEPWQIEDLRAKELEALFNQLHQLGMSIDKRHFILYVEACDNPEELTECLVVDKKTKDNHDPIYLILFELWRRLCPEKLSISIFCDELDLRVHLYDKGLLDTEELIQDGVANLLDLFNENMDKGNNPKKVFEYISKYCAHDLESFLYDYIADQVDEGNDLYANDLIESFYPFLTNIRWFDFLRARIHAKTDEALTNDIIKNIIQDLKKKPDKDLSLEILKFMEQVGEPDLFLTLANDTLLNLDVEADFVELMNTTAEFFLCLDREDKDKTIKTIINKRKTFDSFQKIDQTDPSLKHFGKCLSLT